MCQLVELDGLTAHMTLLLSNTQALIQTDQIDGYLPPHQEVLNSRWPTEESTHSQDNQLQACANSASLHITHVHMGSATFMHAPLGKWFTPTDVKPTLQRTHTNTHSLSHKDTSGFESWMDL